MTVLVLSNSCTRDLGGPTVTVLARLRDGSHRGIVLLRSQVRTPMWLDTLREIRVAIEPTGSQLHQIVAALDAHQLSLQRFERGIGGLRGGVSELVLPDESPAKGQERAALASPTSSLHGAGMLGATAPGSA